MSHDYVIEIDKLIVEKGEKQGNYYRALLTSKEILERLGKPVVVTNHRYVRGIVERMYRDSVLEPIGGDGRNGWKFHIKVRVP